MHMVETECPSPSSPTYQRHRAVKSTFSFFPPPSHLSPHHKVLRVFPTFSWSAVPLSPVSSWHWPLSCYHPWSLLPLTSSSVLSSFSDIRVLSHLVWLFFPLLTHPPLLYPPFVPLPCTLPAFYPPSNHFLLCPPLPLLPQLTHLSFIFPFSSISSDVSNLFHPLIHFLLWPHLSFRYLFLSLNPPSILCSSTPLHPNVPLSCFLLSSSFYYSNLTLVIFSQLILSVHHSFTIYLVFPRYHPLLLHLLFLCFYLYIVWTHISFELFVPQKYFGFC